MKNSEINDLKLIVREIKTFSYDTGRKKLLKEEREIFADNKTLEMFLEIIDPIKIMK